MKPKKTKEVLKVTITIDEELNEWIRVAAFNERLTRSAWMRDAALQKLSRVD